MHKTRTLYYQRVFNASNARVLTMQTATQRNMQRHLAATYEGQRGCRILAVYIDCANLQNSLSKFWVPRDAKVEIYID